jgi:hypothetical protein
LQTETEPFELGYEWKIEGGIEHAFYFLSHIATWPDWWPQIVSVQTSNPEREHTEAGDSALMRAKSFLPYGLDWKTVVREIDAPHRIVVDSEVTLGKRFGMHGVVRFELEQIGPTVEILNLQQIWPNRPVSRFLRPVMALLFNFNHRYAMKRGAPGLQRVVAERAKSVSS